MKSIYLNIELLSDAVFTINSASLGSPRSLGFVPGSALLGALAGRGGYARAQQKGLAWRLFHSGQVRFGNGLPLDATNRPTIPMPLSLHVSKGVEASEEGRGGSFLSPLVRNHARGGRDPAAAYGQVAHGEESFLGTCLEVVRPRHHASMRTAIGEGGRAREGLLFHIDALAEGAVFEARIDVDDDSEAAAVFIARAFKDEVLHLGRSRSAEFGRVRVRVVDEVVNDNPLLRTEDASSSTVLLLAVSDVALRSSVTGLPTQIPTALCVGLPSHWRWEPARSFLRFRSWSPYNGKRQRFDLERQVIMTGSVLSFSAGAALDDAGIKRLGDRLRQGVGDYRQDGLGQLVLNPTLLAGEALPDMVASRPGAIARERVEMPEGELKQWLLAARDERMARERAFQLAGSWLRHLRPWPSIASSQWRGLARVAAPCTTQDELLDALFRSDDAFTCSGVKKSRDRWQVTAPSRRTPLWEALKELIEHEEVKFDVLIDAVRQLAARQARVQHEEGR